MQPHRRAVSREGPGARSVAAQQLAQQRRHHKLETEICRSRPSWQEPGLGHAHFSRVGECDFRRAGQKVETLHQHRKPSLGAAA